MMFISALCFLISFGVNMARTREPQCSQYDFAEKTLEKVIRFEHENKLRNEKIKEMEAKIDDKLDEMEKTLISFKEFQDVMLNAWTKHKESTNDILDKQKDELKRFKDQTATLTILFKAKDATVSSLSDGDVIVYPTDVKNEGGAYNNKTGVFTAPVKGVYMFTAQFCLNSVKALYIHIVAADKVISASLYQQDYGATCYTADAVTVLEKDDHVTVKVRSKSSVNIIIRDNSNNYYWTSFSGVLLHQ